MNSPAANQRGHSLLILSFSPLASDARVLKQINLFSSQYRVTTCGFGPAPAGVHQHIQIPDGLSATKTEPKLLLLRRYQRMYERNAAISWVRENVKPRYAVVLANDVESVPLARKLTNTGLVHADLHEFAPGQREEIPAWRRFIQPYQKWLVRKHVRKVSSWTTVGEGLAREYEKLAGFRPVVVPNAAPYADLTAQPVGEVIRLVHSGAALRGRSLEVMLDAVDATSANVTLDLYLTKNDPAYLAELATRQNSRIRINEPVPYSELITTLNRYDVGVFVLPPVNTNYRLALPNKLFDFIQARLGIIVGPSPEMAAYVTKYDLGQVTTDFTADTLRAALDQLSAHQVATWKAASHASANELASENVMAGWDDAIAALMRQLR